MNLDSSAALAAPVSSEVAPAASTTPAPVVPLSHYEQFYALRDDERLRVAMLLRMCDEIASSKAGVVSTCRRLASEYHSRGFSFGNIKANYYAWKDAGKDWRALVRRYSTGQQQPAEFVNEVKRRIEANSRGARQAILSIYRDWQAGDSIPGYGTWRDHYLAEFPEREVPARWPLGFYPRGWGKSQLYKLQTSKAERALVRRGMAAAKPYLPHVIRDRSGLRPLELIVIDDFETDIVVRARHPQTGRPEFCTCTGLLAIDVGTARKLAVGLKPRFKGEEGQRIAITRADVQQLLYSVFSEHGLPTGYGVTILCENAAAAISADFELALATLLGVQVARTGLLADKTLRNGFVERGGKPWEKGWIETTFNLVHNMAGSLPGQKGASYQLKPGDLEAKLLYAEKLLAIDGLSPEQVAELRVPFLPYEDALTAYEKIFRVMECRTDHKMQGFAEVFEYALADGSGQVTEEKLLTLALSREQLLACTPVARRESPLERWQRIGAGLQFAPVPPAVLALLLLTPKRAALRNHKIAFEHHGKGYVFADADSPVLALGEGAEFLVYFDPARPAVLHCATLDGAYVGPVKRRGAIDLRDREAIGAEQSEIMRVITRHVVEPVRARHAAADAQLADDDRHNLALLRAWKVPAAAIPARLLPKTSPTAPAAPSASRALQNTGDNPNTAQALTLARPVTQSQGLSAQLGRATPAAAQVHAQRAALAQGIAETTLAAGAELQEGRTLAASDDLDASALL
jgi:hypothetical protein